jgi:hypothetical protein
MARELDYCGKRWSAALTGGSHGAAAAFIQPANHHGVVFRCLSDKSEPLRFGEITGSFEDATIEALERSLAESEPAK